MTVILNRRKKPNKGLMKTTHSLQDIEGLINEQLYIMQNGATLKEKKEAKKKVLMLERHMNDVNSKAIKKVYPVRPTPVPISKKELLALIDSVEVDPYQSHSYVESSPNGLDVSGVFISDDRSTEFPRTSILDGKFMPNARHT